MNHTGKPIITAIDDDPVILNFLVSVLKTDFGIRPFTSGITALAYLKEHPADLILLDFQMPDMTGLEVLTRLQSDPVTSEIPTIFLTGSIDSDNEIEALDHGAVDYITKPIRYRSLLTRVRLQLELQAHRKQLEALVEERTKNLNAAYNKLKAREEITLSMLAKATDLRDHGTGDHIERTTELVRVIVNHILNNPKANYTFTNDSAEDVIRSSKLHDLGKISLPDHILLKPDRLTVNEFAVIKTHTLRGERFLSEFVRKMDDSFLDTARDIAYAHHERWDGSGYPLGSKGEKIPLSARIVAIADVYDALTSVRPYKKSLTHEEAAEIIIAGGGTHFDPYLTSIFQLHLDDFRNIIIRNPMDETLTEEIDPVSGDDKEVLQAV